MEVDDFHLAVQSIDQDMSVGIPGQKKREIKFPEVLFGDSRLKYFHIPPSNYKS